MKAVIFCIALGLAVMLPAGTGHAQQFTGKRGQFPGCPTCGVVSSVDYPPPEATVSQSNLWFGGWGFECYSGHPVDRVEIFYDDYEGVGHYLPQPDWLFFGGAVPRPDVQQAFQTGQNGFGLTCPNVPALSGWHLVVTNPPPPGLRRISINIWRGPYLETHRRTYLVKP